MIEIDHTERGDRLEADEVLTPADFARIAEATGQVPVRARKVGFVAAREASGGER